MNEIEKHKTINQRVTFLGRIVTSIFSAYFLAVLYLFFFFSDPWGMLHLWLVFLILGTLSLLNAYLVFATSSWIIALNVNREDDEASTMQESPLAAFWNILLLVCKALWIIPPIFTCGFIILVVFKEITTTKLLAGTLMLIVYIRALLFVIRSRRRTHS